jgi:hypothetical protein
MFVHRHLPLLALSVMFPLALNAEGNCGMMLRSAVRFRAVIRSIEPLGRQSGPFADVDADPKFVVAVEVESVESENAALKRGDRQNFGVHSPSRLFGVESLPGKTVNLEAEWMACDGDFRRFVSLRQRPQSRNVEEPDGWVEVGHTYRITVQWKDSGLESVTRIPVPQHHGWGVEWENPDAFPASARDGAEHDIEVEVVSIRTWRRSEWQFVSIHRLKIVGLP